jgi:hypothetical protein
MTKVWLETVAKCRIGKLDESLSNVRLVINFGEWLVKNGIHRVVNGL